MRTRAAWIAASCLALLGACAGGAKEPASIGFGPSPTLPKPESALIPTVKTAEAVGWPAGKAPMAAPGLKVAAFARGLEHPRWLYVLPNGDVLVAETNAPPKPDDSKGIKGFAMKLVMKGAGAGVPSPNKILLLRDANGDGVAELKTVLLEGVNSPFGMQLIGDRLYVANSDAIWSYPYKSGETHIADLGTKLTDLPAGTINHHWTKNILASRDGSKLYATVGSNSNVGDNGMAVEEGRAAIWEVDVKTGDKRLFATGIRNPNGLAWEPKSGALWTAVNERDEIGHNLVPDYITSVKDGAFYGWPYSYYGQNVDVRVKPQNPGLVAKAIAPDYAVGAHTASLGLTFATGAQLGPNFTEGAFIGQHGSWNRDPFSGYKVIFVPFANGKPAGDPVDVLSGFLSADNKAMGRPVGVVIDRNGGLLVADDVGNAIWRVTNAGVGAGAALGR
jgi:glucose/arabinose dehydrogenase